jgi:hypothetical protein
MVWAAQDIQGETAITMAENRASRLREADARDNEAFDKAIKNFLAYEARISDLVSRARRRFFGRNGSHCDCDYNDLDLWHEEADHLDRYLDEAWYRVDDWHQHLKDERKRMCRERQDRHAQVARLDLLEQEEESHRDELARACDESIKMAQAEADSKAVQASLADEDESFKAKEEVFEAVQASEAEEGSQDLQIAQGMGNMEGNLKITQGMGDQESTAGSVFLIQFKILAAMLEVQEQQGAAKLAIQDGPRARRRRQGALLWIYDPGGIAI